MTGEFSNSFDHGKYFKTGLTFSKILMNSLYKSKPGHDCQCETTKSDAITTGFTRKIN